MREIAIILQRVHALLRDPLSACLGSFNLLKNTFPPIFARPKILFEKKKIRSFFKNFRNFLKNVHLFKDEKMKILTRPANPQLRP